MIVHGAQAYIKKLDNIIEKLLYILTRSDNLFSTKWSYQYLPSFQQTVADS